MTSRDIEPKDIAIAAMGGVGSKKIEFKRMPPVRPDMCLGCPFKENVNVFIALQREVLKDELSSKPQAIWMCHETSDGGARPTSKSLICKGAHDWRLKQSKEAACP